MMLEAARGWLTPAVLFVVVNLVIATIAVASRLMAPGDERRGLLRAPSFAAVDRLRASFSFSRLGLAADHAPLFDDPPAPEPPSPSPQPPPAVGAGTGAAETERDGEQHVERSCRSEAAAEAAPNSRRPRARRMRRAATEEPAAFAHDDGVAPAPGHRAGRNEEPAAVDELADDFIRRFREQLRLQRLDSILRYRDTLRRTGTA